MNNFNDIKKQWAAREIPSATENQFKSIIERARRIRVKQWIGQGVLATTSVILILFFFYISAYKNSTVFLGMAIMIGSLWLRIGIEFLAMIKKSHIPADKNMKQYNQELIRFYNRRKIINFIVTPILFGSYIVGFIMLLPAFKETLSAGFYTYIVVSSWFVFIGLAVLIGVQIKKEMALWRDLQ